MTHKLTTIHWKKFENFLFEIGCEFIRQKGDHRVYKKEGLLRPIIIPKENELPIFVIKNNLKTLGINRKNYLEILNSL